MPSKMEMYREMYSKFWKIILGDETKIDSPMRWYNYIFFITKIAIIILTVIFAVKKKYLYSVICGISVLIDIFNAFRLYRAYKIHKEIEKIIFKKR